MTMTERKYHPERTRHDWTSSYTLSLADLDANAIVGQITVTGDEWERLVAAGVAQLFSGQGPAVSWSDADGQIRAVIDRGFSLP